MGATVTRQSSEPHDVNVEAWNIDAFSARLREAMNGRTPYSIQKETGIAQSLIGKYMKGLSTPGIDKLVLLANTLGVSVAWLASGEGSSNSKPEAGDQPDQLTVEGVKQTEEAGAVENQVESPVRAYAKSIADQPEKSQNRLVAPVTLYVRLIEPLKEMTTGEEEREWVMDRILAMLDALTGGSVPDMLRLDQEDLTHAVHLAAAAWRLEKGKEEAKRRGEIHRDREQGSSSKLGPGDEDWWPKSCLPDDGEGDV